MTGNVWEWTASKWGMDARKPDFGYPYDSKDGREEPDGPDARVVRGGSFDDNGRDVRCASRVRDLPPDFLNYGGFRVVVSLAAPGF